MEIQSLKTLHMFQGIFNFRSFIRYFESQAVMISIFQIPFNEVDQPLGRLDYASLSQRALMATLMASMTEFPDNYNISASPDLDSHRMIWTGQKAFPTYHRV
ncbi:hypothetical protein XU18_3926 [Perkinsela sp. CCAP 1560/4]|nr:hypothetical protein XU18_3926 [Perkinsela sp. CCAP 1560/4]|eukprot:KNH04942.1 hypothetical protein XU18_3926 [Perkinsela sp. CCAP 1560/4]